jgi:hypothetical protein
MADALRVARRVRNRHRAALRHPEEDDALESGGVDDRLEVGDPRVERQVIYLPVRKAAPALVVPDERVHLPQAGEPVPPDRAVPVELQVSEPCRGPHQRRTAAMDGVRDSSAVGRGAESDLLGQVGF